MKQITKYDNQKFGKFTVIETINGSKCLCRCDCGNICETWTYHLKTGKSTSCGCSRLNNGNPRWSGYKEIPLTFFNRIKRKSKERNRNYEFNITIEYLWELFEKQNKKCAASGLDISFPKTCDDMLKRLNISVDRIDKNKGYIKENIRLVKPDINIMKNRLDNNLFLKYCYLVNNPIKTDFSEYIFDKNIHDGYYNALCISAKKRNIDLHITKKDLFELYISQKGKCHYTGLYIILNSSGNFDETPIASIDRIDSSKPYDLENVKFVHKTINLMKNTINDKDFRNYCKCIIEYSNYKN
jgi:hypothetical protein